MGKGYIELQLDKESVNLIKNWLKNSSIDFIDEKTKNNLHLTLFFGLDYNKAPKKEITEKIKKIKLNKLTVKGINTFPLKEYNCKIVYLEVEDKGKKLLSLHNEFLKFPHVEDRNTHKFKPHITLGYISHISKPKRIKYEGPKTLKIKNTKYKKYTK